MAVEIRGERFLRDEAGSWLDLATGTRAISPAFPDRGPAGASAAARAGGQRPRGSVDEPRPGGEAIDQLADAAARTPLGVRVLRVPGREEDSPAALVEAVAVRLAGLGFIPVHDGLVLPPAVIAALRRRHLAILWTAHDRSGVVAAWIRRLTDRGRGHLVVDLRPTTLSPWRDGRPVTRRFVARERTLHESPLPGRPSRADRRLQRGLGLIRRGRRAAGSRWLRAALAAGRRRGDDAAQARAARDLAEALMAQGDRSGALRPLLDVLPGLGEFTARAAVCELAAHVLVVTGELRRADGLLAAVFAEAHVLDVPVPDALTLRLSELRFWQGRVEEADDLAASVAGPRRKTCGVLALAEAAEADVASGRLDDARAALDRAAGGPGASPLDTALVNWLRGCWFADHTARESARAFIRQSGARGITRFGLGRTQMHLLHAVPALLTIVQDAEDDLAVLREGCVWLRRHAGASSAAVVTHDAGRVVAADGFVTADLQHDLIREAVAAERARIVASGGDVAVAAPVKSQCATIGLVVARGSAPAAGSLAEAAAAFAAVAGPALRARLDALARAAQPDTLVPEILGQSPVMHALRESIARAAATQFPVLIEGESGTGKELVARAIHRLSARRDRRFSALNCAALADDLVEAELFGFARGAFTGAVGARAGLFEDAHGGTIFLDEVGDLSARAQAKLLRALQEREVRRLGENTPRRVDVRVVAATNRVLADAVAEGQFREDLRFRLAVIRFRLPPLRDRVEDIPILAHAFWRRLAAEMGRRVALGPDAVAALCRHRWSGNIRELQNAMAALAVQAPPRGRVTARQVGQVLAAEASASMAGTPGASLGTARRTFERQMITAALARHAGRRAPAARELGLTRQGLRKALKRLGVPVVRHDGDEAGDDAHEEAS